MNIFITLKSDIDGRTYSDVELWREVELGEKSFIYLSNIDKTERAYIAVEDILRITIEEKKND